jgi:hypothetical protein
VSKNTEVWASVLLGKRSSVAHRVLVAQLLTAQPALCGYEPHVVDKWLLAQTEDEKNERYARSCMRCKAALRAREKAKAKKAKT